MVRSLLKPQPQFVALLHGIRTCGLVHRFMMASITMLAHFALIYLTKLTIFVLQWHKIFMLRTQMERHMTLPS